MDELAPGPADRAKQKAQPGGCAFCRSDADPTLDALASSRGSGRLEVVVRVLAGPFVLDDLVRQLLAFIEARKPRALDSGDMHEHISPPLVGLNEAIALLAIEPFHSAG